MSPRSSCRHGDGPWEGQTAGEALQAAADSPLSVCRARPAQVGQRARWEPAPTRPDYVQPATNRLGAGGQYANTRSHGCSVLMFAPGHSAPPPPTPHQADMTTGSQQLRGLAPTVRYNNLKYISLQDIFCLRKAAVTVVGLSFSLFCHHETTLRLRAKLILY